MKRRTNKLMLLHKSSNPSDSSPARAKVMAMVVGVPSVPPVPHSLLSRPKEASRVNDNYSILDPIDSQCCTVQRLNCCVKKTVN